MAGDGMASQTYLAVLSQSLPKATWPCTHIISQSKLEQSTACVLRDNGDVWETKLDRLRGYFRSNPGALFIVAFQILLASAGILLVSGAQSLADRIAVYAFYALVTGIAVQIAVAVREARKSARSNSAETLTC